MFRLSSLLLASTLLLAGGEAPVTPLNAGDTGDQEEEKKQNSDARFRIPAGAVLTDVPITRFNKDGRKVSVLWAREMTVESDELVSASDLKIWTFDKDEEIRSLTTIPEGEYHIQDEQIEATGDLLLRALNDDYLASGRGGIFSLKTGQALLLGPATTIFRDISKSNKRVSMKLTPTLQTLPTFLATMNLLVAAPPPFLTEEQLQKVDAIIDKPTEVPEPDLQALADFERAVAPRFIPDVDVKTAFATADQLNAGLESRLAAYLTKIGKSELLLQTTAPVPAKVTSKIDPLAEAFNPTKEHVRIRSNKGIYFDGESYELVYLGDIELEGKGVIMTCNKDLKVIFDPPPPEEKKAKEKEKESKKLKVVGEMKQVTASGNLRLKGEHKGETFYLGGDRALYEHKTGTITIRGDKLAFRQGDNLGRALHKNAYAVVTIFDNTVKSVVFSKEHWEHWLHVPDQKK